MMSDLSRGAQFISLSPAAKRQAGERRAGWAWGPNKIGTSVPKVALNAAVLGDSPIRGDGDHLLPMEKRKKKKRIRGCVDVFVTNQPTIIYSGLVRGSQASAPA